jgi:hypothetical protein
MPSWMPGVAAACQAGTLIVMLIIFYSSCLVTALNHMWMSGPSIQAGLTSRRAPTF